MKNWKIWLGIIISVASLAYFCRDLSPTQMWAAMRSANYLYLIPAILLLYAGIYVRGWRWQLFFKEIRRVPYNRLFAIEMIGFMGNSMYPFRAGEFMRAYLLGRREKVGVSASIATITLERLFDLVAVIGALVIVFVTIPFPESPAQQDTGLVSLHGLRQWGSSSAVFFFVLVAALALMVYRPRLCEAVMRVVLRPLPESLGHRVFGLYQSFVEGLAVLRDRGAVVIALFHTAVIWFTIAASEYMVIKAFGFPINFLGALFIMMSLALAVMAPQAPGYIGVFHVVVAWAVGVLGVSETSDAKAFALVLWFVQMIPIVLAGWLCLAWLGLSLGELRKESEKGEPPRDGSSTEASLDALASRSARD
jgi:uncharacterized protein (TIRG00374 family)